MKQRIFTVRILWAAMLTTVVLYVVVLQAIPIQVPTEPLNPIMPLVFGGVGLSTAIMSFIIPKLGVRQGLLSLKLPLVEAPDSSAAEAFKKTIRTFAHPEDAAIRALGVCQTGYILAYALSEAIALFGFVLCFLGYGWVTAGPFFVAGFLLIAIRFPKAEAIVRALESSYGVKFPETSSQ